MNVSEMENLIQQITDQICQQLLSSSYSSRKRSIS